MSLIKIIRPDPVHLNLDRRIVVPVPVSSRGLIGYDRQQMIKIACIDIVESVDRIKTAADEPLVHVIVVGADEDYGANRNGDAFVRQVCHDYHDTFEKYAYFFRDHKNKDPKKSYGRIKKAFWNDRMKRIELLVALNGSEEAARRNDGLYADREMEKLASGRDIPVSMACRVPFDICSWCNNKAPSVEDYCFGVDEGGMCKAGGLRDNIGAIVDMGDDGLHQLRAMNTQPAFFDCSHVFRGADRIAFVTGQLEKAASVHGGGVSSATLARELGVTLPYSLLVEAGTSTQVNRMMKLAYELSEIETDLEEGRQLASDAAAAAFSPIVQDTKVEFPQFFKEKFAHSLRALADARVCLPLEKFIEVVADQPREKAASTAQAVGQELPGIYGRLLADGRFADRLAENPYMPAAHESSQKLRSWAEKQASSLSLAEHHVRRRTSLASLRGTTVEPARRGQSMEKTATDRGPVGQLAEHYAMYKLAFLGSLPESDPELPLTSSLVIIQNYS